MTISKEKESLFIMSGGKNRGKDGIVSQFESAAIIQYDDLGKKFVNPDLVKFLQEHGFYVCSVELANRFMKESLELARLKASYAETISKGD